MPLSAAKYILSLKLVKPEILLLPAPGLMSFNRMAPLGVPSEDQSSFPWIPSLAANRSLLPRVVRWMGALKKKPSGKEWAVAGLRSVILVTGCVYATRVIITHSKVE